MNKLLATGLESAISVFELRNRDADFPCHAKKVRPILYNFPKFLLNIL